MTESRTLQFESSRALQSLYANDIKLLKNLEDSLGVKVTTREGWVKLEGDPSRVAFQFDPAFAGRHLHA